MILRIQEQTGASTRSICRVLGLPRSSHCLAARPSPRCTRDQQLGSVIQCLFKEHHRRYGYRRIYRELKGSDHLCGPNRVRRLMKEHSLKASQPKVYRPCTSDGRADAPAPNLLLDQSPPQNPNEVWVGDITFIATQQGWRYLAVVMDLYSRKIIGWHLANHLRSDLVCQAMNNALASRRLTTQKLIFHSDRGSQYGSRAFRGLLASNRITQSMSRRANPYDNAWSESFIGTLKKELLKEQSLANETQARIQLFEYIEGYYNTRRLHSALGYLSPNQYEHQHSTNI